MKKTLTSLTFICGFALVAGCTGSGNTNSVSTDAILSDLTPELASVTERRVDIDSNEAVTQNLEWRMFWDDLARAWMTDHPTRLSPYPVRCFRRV